MKSGLLAAFFATCLVPLAQAQLPKAMAELPPLTEDSAQRDARMQ